MNPFKINISTYSFHKQAVLADLHKLFLVILVLIFNFSVNAEQKSPILEVNANTNSETLGRYLLSLEDKSQQLTINQVSQLEHNDWTIVESDIPNYGMSDKVYWFKLTTQNITANQFDLLLSIEYPPLDDLQTYVSSDNINFQKTQLGDNYPFNYRNFNNRNFILPLNFLPHENKSIYFKIRTDGSLQLPIHLRNYQSFLEKDQTIVIGLGAYIGIMLAMAFYNLFLFISIRESVYFYFSMTIFAYSTFQAGITGIGYQYWWTNLSSINNLMFPLSMSLGLASACAFMLTFLQVKKHNKTHYNLLKLFMLLSLCTAIGSLFLPFHLSIRLASTLGLPISILGIWVSSSILFKGFKFARLFLIAWISFITFSFLLSLNKFGILPRNSFTENAVLIGNILSVLLMSLALAERININKKELINAQQDALELEKKARQEKERYYQLELDAKREEIKAQQKIYEAQSESEAKSNFMAVMSHEIRTPMNGVLGMTEILKDTKLSKQQKQYLSVIENSGRSLLAIINDILDYSKIEAGKMQLDEVEVELDSLCLEITASFSWFAEKKNIQFIGYIKPETTNLIITDPNRLKQIIINLVGNAFKFTNEGFIQLKVESITEQKQNKLLFSIIDTGIGISETDQSKLFKKFTQADNSTTRQYGGTGLGLSISQKLANLMGGNIKLLSQKGHGTTFTFTVDYQIPNQLTKKTVKPTNLLNQKILFIDSSIEYTQLLKNLFDYWQAEITISRSVAETEKLLFSNNKNNDNEIESKNKNSNKNNDQNDAKYDIICFDENTLLSWPVDVINRLIDSLNKQNAKLILLNQLHNKINTVKNKKNSSQQIIDDYFENNKSEKPILVNQLYNILSNLINNQLDTNIASNQSKYIHYQQQLNNKTALIAEDNPINQIVIKKMLSMIGVKSLLATNGKQAISLYQENHKELDFVLMDCEMPNIDGYQATQEIRLWESANKIVAVPIIALTAHALEEHQIKSQNAGMNWHLSKPIEIDKLAKTLINFSDFKKLND